MVARGRSLRYRGKSWRKETAEIDATYVTIVFKLRRHQSLVFWCSRLGRMATIGVGFLAFCRCYMTRVTAASVPGRFPCSRITLHLPGVYVPALLSAAISTFNDRNGKSAGQKWLRASGNVWAPAFFTSSLSPLPSSFFSFLFLFFLPYGKTAESSQHRCRDTVPV